MCPRQLVHGRLVEGGRHDSCSGPSARTPSMTAAKRDGRSGWRGPPSCSDSPLGPATMSAVTPGPATAPIDLAGMVSPRPRHGTGHPARAGPVALRWPTCRHGWSTSPARSTATRWCGSTGPSPNRGPARSGCACGPAGCAGPISTSPRATWSPRRPRVTPGHEVVGMVDQLGPGSTRWREGDRIGVPWLAHTCGICRFCLSGRENLCLEPRFTGWDVDGGYADVRRGGRGLRLRAARRVRRRGGRAAALRRDHRLPGAAAGQPPRGRPARHLRLRRLGPSHGPGRAGPRRPRPRHDPLPGGATAGPRARRRQRRGTRTPRRRSRSTRPSCSRRSARSCRPRWPPWTGAGRWPSPAST